MFTGRLAGAMEPHPGVASRHVLVVDDHLDTREIYALLLRGSGYTVYEAPDGPSALAVLQRKHVDAIILDIGLPGMDGYEVARVIRADGSHADVRLIAVTGYGSPEDRERARAAGFDRHLVKPVTPDEFLGSLE